MVEGVSARGVFLAVICFAVSIAALTGCGGDSSSSSKAATIGVAVSEGDKTTTADVGANPGGDIVEENSSSSQRRRQLKRTVEKLDRPKQVCSIMSDLFLKDTYGAPGEAGRKRCQAGIAARGGAPRHLRSYRIVEYGPERAEVLAVDSKGSKAVMTFAFASGKWLLDDVRSP